MRDLTGIELIAEERYRQINRAKGYPPRPPAFYEGDKLARAAACYAVPEPIYTYFGFTDRRDPVWPWPGSGPEILTDRLNQLIKAGSLIAAEIDRLLERQRATSPLPAGDHHVREGSAGVSDAPRT